jgi:hypothetical protein
MHTFEAGGVLSFICALVEKLECGRAVAGNAQTHCSALTHDTSHLSLSKSIRGAAGRPPSRCRDFFLGRASRRTTNQDMNRASRHVRDGQRQAGVADGQCAWGTDRQGAG